MKESNLTQRLSAEFLGTLWLVFGACGSASGTGTNHLGFRYVKEVN